MTPSSPAIVSQSAVRRLPRWALILLCLAYVLPGFIGRDPWKNADITSFGYMRALAEGKTDWFAPLLGGMTPDTEGLLPYWIGAWALKLAPAWMSPEFATRWPYALMLVLTMVATWHAAYYLARSPKAQPVAFAFGGEAQPIDYARAIADGAVLALIACLGLAQLSHELTSHVVQLTCTTLLFFAVAASPYRVVAPAIAGAFGIVGLALSGAPSMMAMLATASAAIVFFAQAETTDHRKYWATATALVAILAALLSAGLGLWQWHAQMPPSNGKEWGSMTRLLLWFGWPAWPLAIWTTWRWRRQIFTRSAHRHLLLPIAFVAITLIATLTTQPADRALLMGLPAMATLAAFALPTLRRGVSALIDWFTMLFFSVSAIAIWVIWIAMQTGVPAKTAANVTKLAPGFAPEFSWIAFLAALASTIGWCVLVWWRTSRNRAALWKSLVLPAGGATLGWMLLMTLWLPLLNYARSYSPQIQLIQNELGPQPGCINIYGFNRAQTSAAIYHGHWDLRWASIDEQCQWLLAPVGAWSPSTANEAEQKRWSLVASVPRPTDKDDNILVMRRQQP